MSLKGSILGIFGGILMGLAACVTAQAQVREEAQVLFEAICEEKKEEYLEEHPDGSEEDERAGFQVNERLEEAAAHRLKEAGQKGYTNGRIPGEGTIGDYLVSIPYQGSRTCMELYLRNCSDGWEAYEKFEEKMMERYEEKEDRKYLPEYYREIGMACREADGAYDFLILLMR